MRKYGSEPPDNGDMASATLHCARSRLLSSNFLCGDGESAKNARTNFPSSLLIFADFYIIIRVNSTDGVLRCISIT